MKTHEVEELREAVTHARGEHRDKRIQFPTALRERVIAYAKHAQSNGMGMSCVAEVVGMHAATLDKWLRKTRPRSAVAHRSRFLTVKVKDDAPSASIVIVSPSGWRAEVSADVLRSLMARSASPVGDFQGS